MMLTGEQIWSRSIIRGGECVKVDDGVLPSYGLDGMLYTFRARVAWQHMTIGPLNFLCFDTLETVDMPKNCGGLLYLKSTYSRRGLVLTTNSPVDPGYEGSLKIGLFNGGLEPVKLFGQGGFMQLVVHEMSEEVEAYDGRWQSGG